MKFRRAVLGSLILVSSLCLPKLLTLHFPATVKMHLIGLQLRYQNLLQCQSQLIILNWVGTLAAKLTG